MVTRKCNKCEVELVIEENWSMGNAKSYNYICKSCQIKKSKKYREDKPEFCKKIAKEYYEKNKEAYRDRYLKYYSEKKEEILARNKKWNDANRKKKKEMSCHITKEL